MKRGWKSLHRAVAAALLTVCLGLASPAGAEQEIDPAALDAAVELVEAANMDGIFETVLPLFSQQIVQVVLKVKPELKGKLEPLVDEFLETARKESRAELLQDMAKLYARRLTAAEIRDITAFYRTETGKKLVAVLPQIQLDAAEVGKVWGQEIARKTLTRLRAKLKEQGHEF